MRIPSPSHGPDASHTDSASSPRRRRSKRTPSPALRSAVDWWIIVLGSGLRWTVEQMGPTVQSHPLLHMDSDIFPALLQLELRYGFSPRGVVNIEGGVRPSVCILFFKQHPPYDIQSVSSLISR